MSINKVILSGNVGHTPKVTNFDNGGCIVQFSLATTEKGFTTQSGREIPDRTMWHAIVVNRKGLSDVAGKYIHKGDRVSVVGKILYREYEDKDGNKRQVTEILAEEIELAPKPKDEEKKESETKVGNFDDMPF